MFKLVTTVVTIALALAASVWWFLSSVAPIYWPNAVIVYPEIQIPFGFTLTAMAGLGWVLLALEARRRDSETRCRRCQYILRGLSEPRCPECGERI